MSKIPTAKEFLKDKWDRENGTNAYNILDKDNALNCLKEFAKLHVKAAIKECIESAPSGSSTDTVSYEDVEKALKNCYPETNIK